MHFLLLQLKIYINYLINKIFVFLGLMSLESRLVFGKIQVFTRFCHERFNLFVVVGNVALLDCGVEFSWKDYVLSWALNFDMKFPSW